MNNYTEFNSKSFLIILFLICTVFLVLIIKAFSFIPDTENASDTIVSRNNSINTPVENRVSEEQTAAVETNNQIEQKAETKEAPQRKELLRPSAEEALENIDNLPQEAAAENVSEITADSSATSAEPSDEEKILKVFAEAGKLKKEKQYVRAIEEYKNISTITNDVNTIAKSYEEIATIYAIVKRYGTALSYAQKAYNMSPSSSREMLLARLYYKTGDIDKATRRVNNVLQRDFSADR